MIASARDVDAMITTERFYKLNFFSAPALVCEN
jgi:hypothetical protein